jgi:hypothetical protein
MTRHSIVFAKNDPAKVMDPRVKPAGDAGRVVNQTNQKPF